MNNANSGSIDVSKYWMRILVTWMLWVGVMVAGGVFLWRKLSGPSAADLAAGAGSLSIDVVDVDQFSSQLEERRFGRSSFVAGNPFNR